MANGRTCGLGGTCTNTPAPGASRCWPHLPADALGTSLDKLARGAHLDFRNATLLASRRAMIFERLRDSAGQVRIGSICCDNATFEGAFRLVDVLIDGTATFVGCTFREDITLA